LPAISSKFEAPLNDEFYQSYNASVPWMVKAQKCSDSDSEDYEVEFQNGSAPSPAASLLDVRNKLMKNYKIPPARIIQQYNELKSKCS